MKPAVLYVYAGLMERVRGGRYTWVSGYSENGITQPWVTKREAQQDAKRRGARAVFKCCTAAELRKRGLL